MSTFQRFEDIDAWQLGRELTNRVYEVTRGADVTRGATFARDFGLRDQIRRACISITSNIAEGFERHSNRDFARFLLIAKASCAEVRSQLYCALDQGYIDHAEFDALQAMCMRIGGALHGLIRYLHSTAVSEPSTLYPEP